jgi:hypothetical protein
LAVSLSLCWIVAASFPGDVCAADPPDPAKTRAEIERKSRELKKKVDDRLKEAEAQRRAVRERLNLRAPSSAAASSSTAKSSPPNAEESRKNSKLREPRSPGKPSLAGLTPNEVHYAPKRGQEFAFRVEMKAEEGGLEKQWVGTPYFASIYSDVGADVRISFAEMFCIGKLACCVRSSVGRPWTAIPTEDIEFPERFLFGPLCVLGTETTGLFDEHTLPFQISAVMPPEELIFPRLPIFSDSARNESTTRTRFYLRGGPSNLMGVVPTKDLDGEYRRVCRVEQESSPTPRIINERAFHCPAEDVGLSLRQVGTIDAREGMITSVDLDYLLELGEEVRVTVTVRRLFGSDQEAARTAAFAKRPPDKWPPYFHRVPADASEFGLKIPRSESDVPPNQRVSVSIAIRERDMHGFRSYLARTVPGAPAGKIRVRLEGSSEELDVHPSDVRLPK